MNLPEPRVLLRLLRERPSTPRSLRRRLHLPESAEDAVRAALDGLVRAGRARERRGRFHAAVGDDDALPGRFLRHPAGFGFVRLDAEGEPDVHLPRPDAGGLMHGDRVQVRILREDRRGRRRGRVVRVIEPAPRRATGVLELRGRRRRVVPYEERIARRIDLEGALPRHAADRMAVGVEILGLPDEEGVARGRIVEVLGYPDEPGMDVEIIIRRFDLPHRWPEEVSAEAASLPGDLEAEELSRREDFRQLPTVTIDGETAEDFDDAVSLERPRGGGFRLYVHIADVAHYVAEGSAIDREALARGTSVYFPGRAVPMLPERLSNDLCSLRPGVVRLVRTVVLDLDGEGRRTAVRFADGAIRSAARMTYTEVARILVDRDPRARRRHARLVEGLEDMEALCRVLRRRRRERGSIDFDLPEPEIVLNARGEMTGVFPAERTVAHQMIEEFMLAANEAVASHLFRAGVPSLYRAHEEPDPERLEAFDEVLGTLGHRLPRPLDAIKPGHLQDLLELVAGRPEERFVSRLMLRAMQQARYDPQSLGHFALAFRHYTHFTSPIRRYPDLVVHRVLRALQGGRLAAEGVEADRLRSALPEVAEQTSRLERRAEEAERELEEWKKIDFMGERVGEEFHGFVAAATSFGLFVQLEEFFVEGLVHVSSMTDDHYRFEERGHLLRGDATGKVYRLGDRVHVRVVRVDHFLKRMDLELVVDEARSGPGRGGSRRRRDAGRPAGRRRRRR